MTRSASFLRIVLLVDAASCVGMGLLMLLGADPLSGLLGLPASLLEAAGMVLFPFAALCAWLAVQESPWRSGVLAVIGLNVLWTAGSILLPFSGWVQPAALGTTFVISQAIAVGILAELEYVGLKRKPGPAAQSLA